MREDWREIPVDRREVERYLGYQKIQPDETIRGLVEDCIDALEAACTPRSVMGEYPILWGNVDADQAGQADQSDHSRRPRTAKDSGSTKNSDKQLYSSSSGAAGPTAALIGNDPADPDPSGRKTAGAVLQHEKAPTRLIRIAGMEIRSRSLSRNLKGCTQAVLLAATLGPGCDRLVRRAEVTSMVRAAVLQATGAALIEAYADKVNQDIIRKARTQGLYCRPRFSPGYGDLPLSLQKDFFRILDISRRIGVSLSDSLLMTPTKSITAVIGLSPKETSCILQGCETCNLHGTCPYARDSL